MDPDRQGLGLMTSVTVLWRLWRSLLWKRHQTDCSRWVWIQTWWLILWQNRFFFLQNKWAFLGESFLSPCSHSVITTKLILAQEPNSLFSVSKSAKPPLTITVYLLGGLMRYTAVIVLPKCYIWLSCWATGLKGCSSLSGQFKQLTESHCDSGYAAFFGGGTKLTVLGKNLHSKKE